MQYNGLHRYQGDFKDRS